MTKASLDKRPRLKAIQGYKIIGKKSTEAFISQCNERGIPDKEKCPNCSKWFNKLYKQHISQCGRKRGKYMTDEVNGNE